MLMADPMGNVMMVHVMKTPIGILAGCVAAFASANAQEETLANRIDTLRLEKQGTYKGSQPAALSSASKEKKIIRIAVWKLGKSLATLFECDTTLWTDFQQAVQKCLMMNDKGKQPRPMPTPKKPFSNH